MGAKTGDKAAAQKSDDDPKAKAGEKSEDKRESSKEISDKAKEGLSAEGQKALKEAPVSKDGSLKALPDEALAGVLGKVKDAEKVHFTRKPLQKEHHGDAHDKFELKPASKEEKDFVEIIYKALAHQKDQQTPPTQWERFVNAAKFWKSEPVEMLAPGKRERNTVFDAVKKLESLEELKKFVSEVGKTKLDTSGKPLQSSDWDSLNPLTFQARQGWVNAKEARENRRQVIAEDLKKGLGTREVQMTLNGLQTEETILNRFYKNKLEESNHFIVRDMLQSLTKDKLSLEDYANLSTYALVFKWDNHNHGSHEYKTPILDEIYKDAEKNLSPEDMAKFEQRTTNMARAVAVHAALENEVFHGLLGHSADPITMRAVLAPLDGENRKQVVDALEHLTGGHLKEQLEHKLGKPQDLYAIEEMLSRTGKIDTVDQVMVGLRTVGKRFQLDKYDAVMGVEWPGIKNGEVGILKRAALLDSEGWKKLEERCQKEMGISLSDFPKVKDMPKAFATFFETLHETKGRFDNYDSLKKIVDSSTKERRFDLVSLALQVSSQEVREKMMSDKAENQFAKGKSTMEYVLDTFGTKAERGFIHNLVNPSEFLDLSRLELSRADKERILTEYFKDGEESLLTKVYLNSNGLFRMNKAAYAREHEAQYYSTDTSGIKAFFSTASDKQIEKVQNDPDYRAELRQSLEKAMSQRESAILIADLMGKEGLTTGLLSLRPPGWITKTDTADLRYRRYLEEQITDKDADFWAQNIKNEAEVERLRKDLSATFAKPEIDYIVSALKIKFADGAKTLSEITKTGLGNRLVGDELKDAKDPADVVRAILKVTDASRSKLSDQNYLKEVEATIASKASKLSKDQGESLKSVASDLLRQIKAGEKVELDPISMVKLAGAVDLKDPFIPLNAIQSAFDKVPGLKEQLEKDPQLRTQFKQALYMATSISTKIIPYSETTVPFIFSPKPFEHILKGEPLRIEELVQFAGDMPSKREVVLNYAKPDEVKALLEKTDDPKKLAWQESVLGVSPQKDLILSCLEKGYCDTPDQVRMASLSYKRYSNSTVENLFLGVQRNAGPLFFGNVSAAPAISAYNSLERSQVQSVEQDGFRRFHSLPSQDLLERASVGEKFKAQLSYTQTDMGPLEQTLAAFAKRDGVRSPWWQFTTDVLLNGKSGIEVENANNALLKAMMALKTETEVLGDVTKLTESIDSPELKKRWAESLENFSKSMETYNKAEQGIADRVQALADLINTMSVVFTYGAGSTYAFGRLVGGAYISDAAFVGKVTAKAQMGLSYWITSSALRENMNVEAAVVALTLFPAIQAKLPIVFNGIVGKSLGIAQKPLGHNMFYKVMHNVVDVTLAAGIGVGVPVAMYYNPPRVGVNAGSRGFVKPENGRLANPDARAARLQIDTFSRIMDIGDTKK